MKVPITNPYNVKYFKNYNNFKYAYRLKAKPGVDWRTQRYFGDAINQFQQNSPNTYTEFINKYNSNKSDHFNQRNKYNNNNNRFNNRNRNNNNNYNNKNKNNHKINRNNNKNRAKSGTKHIFNINNVRDDVKGLQLIQKDGNLYAFDHHTQIKYNISDGSYQTSGKTPKDANIYAFRSDETNWMKYKYVESLYMNSSAVKAAPIDAKREKRVRFNISESVGEKPSVYLLNNIDMTVMNEDRVSPLYNSDIPDIDPTYDIYKNIDQTHINRDQNEEELEEEEDKGSVKDGYNYLSSDAKYNIYKLYYDKYIHNNNNIYYNKIVPNLPTHSHTQHTLHTKSLLECNTCNKYYLNKYLLNNNINPSYIPDTVTDSHVLPIHTGYDHYQSLYSAKRRYEGIRSNIHLFIDDLNRIDQLPSSAYKAALNSVRKNLPDHLGVIRIPEIGNVIALYDTGASISAIDADYARKHFGRSRILQRKSPLHSSTANGNITLRDYVLTKIQQRNREIDCKLYLIPKLGFHIILSRNAIKHLGYKLIHVDNTNKPIKFVHHADLSHLQLDENDPFYNRIDYGRVLDASMHPINTTSDNERWAQAQSASNLAKVSIGDCSDKLKDGIHQLIKNNQSIVAQSEADVGLVPGVELELELKPGARPFAIKQPYNVHAQYYKEAMRQIDLLLTAGWIRPSKSPWAAGITFSEKKTGGLRMCMDLRQLNLRLKDLRHGMPDITALISKFHGKNCISSLDLKSGYWNIAIAECDKQKTAFLAPDGTLYEWNRMPFGIKTAPMFFQKIMSDIFKGLAFVQVYLDDVVVLSETESEHLDHLKIVFDRLRKYNLKMRLDKCTFAVKEIEYLGFVVDATSHRPTARYSGKILDCKVPTSKKELEAFLGLCNWIGRFIPNLSGMTRPLYELTHKNAKYIWTDVHHKLFNEIKSKIQCIDRLYLPDLNKDFYVETDASEYGMGAVLMQKDDKGVLQPVEWLSKSFDQTQLNWSVGEKECYAAIHAIEKWEKYLKVRHFTLYTDHQNLSTLFNFARIFKGNKLWRWALRLQEYSFTVTARPGSQQVVSDYLSRYIDQAFKGKYPAKIVIYADSHDKDSSPVQAHVNDPNIYLNHIIDRYIHHNNYIYARPHNTVYKLSYLLREYVYRNTPRITMVDVKYPTEYSFVNGICIYNLSVYNHTQSFSIINNNNISYICDDKSDNIQCLLHINHNSSFKSITQSEIKSEGVNLDPLPRDRQLYALPLPQSYYLFDSFKYVDDRNRCDDARDIPIDGVYPVLTRSMKRKLIEQGKLDEDINDLRSKALQSIPESNPKSKNDYFREWIEMRDKLNENELGNENKVDFISDKNELIKAQWDDPICVKLIQFCKTYKSKKTLHHTKLKPILNRVLSDIPKVVRQQMSKMTTFSVHDNILYKGNCIYIPSILRFPLIKFIHDQYHHPRLDKMTRILINKYYWPGMKEDILRIIRSCQTCFRCSDFQRKNVRPLNPFPTERVFQTVHIDIVGPLKQTKSGYKYILTMCDRFSRYFECAAMKDMTAPTCAKIFITKWITSFGIPESIISDQGVQFEGKVFDHICKILHIKRKRTTAYRPLSNGRLERIHRELKKHLRVIAASYNLNFTYIRTPKPVDNWNEYLDVIKYKLNCTPSPATGYAPIQLVLGYIPRMPEDHVWDVGPKHDLNIRTHKQYLDWLKNTKELVRASAITNQKIYDKKRKAKYDKKVTTKVLYKKGDLVRHWIYDKDKMHPKWSIKHRITDFLDENVVRIYNPQTKKYKTVNVDHITLSSHIHLPELEPIKGNDGCKEDNIDKSDKNKSDNKSDNDNDHPMNDPKPQPKPVPPLEPHVLFNAMYQRGRKRKYSSI